MKDDLTNTARALSLFSAALVLLLSSTAAAQAIGDPCSIDINCDSNFCVDGFCCNEACDQDCDACSAAKKGTVGDDGTCGLAAAGTVCVDAACNPSNFHFEPASTCDAAGTCVDGGPAVDCLQHDGICSFDLCHDQNGCEVVKAPDGQECGDGMACFDGSCEDAATASAGSGISTGGAPGSGGAGADAGSTGTGFGGAGTPVEGGSTDVNSGCSCSVVGDDDRSHGAWLLLALAGVTFGRRRRVSPIL